MTRNFRRNTCTFSNISASQHFLSKQLKNSNLCECQRQSVTCDFPCSQLHKQIKPQLSLIRCRVGTVLQPTYFKNKSGEESAPSLDVKLDQCASTGVHQRIQLILKKSKPFQRLILQRIQERPQIIFDSGVMFFYDFSANFSHALTHLWDIIQYSY